ncbi:MAG: hypothetical protein F2929_00035 [Actinobacteria bacterium]|nr:hypothetical protein [Actinomycetota bacterium]
MSLMFPYSPGDQFKRADMHDLIGGSFRHGMTKCNGGNDYLLFHDPKNSKKFGYDKWEGKQADGSFHYSGQGTLGNQKLTRANMGLIKANEQGIPIHLIESLNGTCTYLGQYILGDPTFSVEKAPDVKGHVERDIFVFKLVPIANYMDADLSLHLNGRVEGATTFWVPPTFETILLSDPANSRKQIDRVENKLQAEFGGYLISNGHEVLTHSFSFEGLRGTLKPDFWIPCLGLVVEAKPSNAREFIRLAIGQVLDYANLSKLEGNPMIPAILVPNRPTADLCSLINDLGITMIFRNRNNQFEIHPAK